MKFKLSGIYSLIGAIIAGIAASLCCAGPLILMSLGIGGGWVSTFTLLAPYRTTIIFITIALLFVTFWILYIKPRRCVPDKVCEKPSFLITQRIIFWIVCVLLFLLIAFPWYADWLI